MSSAAARLGELADEGAAAPGMRGFVDARVEAAADVAHAQLAPADSTSFDDDAPATSSSIGGGASPALRAALAKSKPRKAAR